MAKRRGEYRIWGKNRREIDDLEETEVAGKIKLKRFFKKKSGLCVLDCCNSGKELQ
jgi:hypothetical protein